MKNIFLILGVFMLVFYTQKVWAGECTHNSWQPTFVRHDKVAHVYYVTPKRKFLLMKSPQHAQDTCLQYGVRKRISGQTCAKRNWGDFGCGCNKYPPKNSTCAAFHNFLQSEGVRIP